MTPRKTDPNTTLLRARIPNELYEEFKIYCVREHVNNSVGLKRILEERFGSNLGGADNVQQSPGLVAN